MTSKRILIIDDDAEFCEELVESLNCEGYLADHTTDSCKGESLIRNGNYNTILLDFKMQELTGMDIIKKLKEDSIKKHIFIVTGKPSAEGLLKEKDLLDFVSGVIIKPVNFNALLKRIKA